MTSLRVMQWSPQSKAKEIALKDLAIGELSAASGADWVWIDADASNSAELVELGEQLGLDRLAMFDAVSDVDLSKVDDFGEHLLIVLHGLSEDSTDEIRTYELDMFLTTDVLITVRSGTSRTIDHLWQDIRHNHELSDAGPDVLAARISSAIMKRWASIVTSFDEQLDDLIERAFEADKTVLRDVTFLRTELSTIRRTLRPQLETLAELRTTSSPLIGQRSQRRYADAFDTSTRIEHAIEGVRAELLAALDAYRGAEARTATEISRVLTIYAAILLPLSFIVGFFGMNVPNLPGSETPSAWLWIVAAMVLITAISLSIFAKAGWIRLRSPARPSTFARRTLELARRPVDYGHKSKTSYDSLDR